MKLKKLINLGIACLTVLSLTHCGKGEQIFSGTTSALDSTTPVGQTNDQPAPDQQAPIEQAPGQQTPGQQGPILQEPGQQVPHSPEPRFVVLCHRYFKPIHARVDDHQFTLAWSVEYIHLYVNIDAMAGHLKHGDYLGQCESHRYHHY